MTWVSPNHRRAEYGPNPSLDDKIEVFKDRVQGWQLDIAKATEADAHGGYGVISIVFSYFEMIEQYAEGTDSDDVGSKATFGQGFKKVYPSTPLTNAEIDTVYKRVRCGMYHEGFTKFGTTISADYPDAVAISGDEVRVNPHKLLAGIQSHFEGYVATLEDESNTSARSKFETTFDRGWSG